MATAINHNNIAGNATASGAGQQGGEGADFFNGDQATQGRVLDAVLHQVVKVHNA
jgi:hypothetical protein